MILELLKYEYINEQKKTLFATDQIKIHIGKYIIKYLI